MILKEKFKIIVFNRYQISGGAKGEDELKYGWSTLRSYIGWKEIRCTLQIDEWRDSLHIEQFYSSNCCIEFC